MVSPADRTPLPRRVSSGCTGFQQGKRRSPVTEEADFFSAAVLPPNPASGKSLGGHQLRVGNFDIPGQAKFFHH